MAILTVMIIVAIWAVWVAYEVNKDKSYPLDTENKSAECNKDCRQGRDCDCFQRSCDLTVKEYDTWPFPRKMP